jgi:hypothetical protein
MNANELADKLSDKTMRDYIVFEYLPEIVSMLRKQQESIEGLNRDYDLLFAEHQLLLLKKEWVGLTQTQVKLLWEGVREEAVKSGDSLNWVFYTHINEALKEKNK